MVSWRSAGVACSSRADVAPQRREAVAADERGEIGREQRRVVVAQILPEEGQPARERAGLHGERQQQQHRRRRAAPITIAGVMPPSVPMWRCQVESQSKVWNGVQSAVCSKCRHSCSIAARSVCTDSAIFGRGPRAAGDDPGGAALGALLVTKAARA